MKNLYHGAVGLYKNSLHMIENRAMDTKVRIKGDKSNKRCIMITTIVLF